MALASAPTSLIAAVAPSQLRQVNQRVLLDHLFTHGPCTRPQLGKACGLSQPTVIAALTDLEKAGLARVSRLPAQPVGRPAVAYEADSHAGSVAAIDIGRDWLHLVLTDLAGEQLSELDVRNKARSATALVNLVGRSFDKLTSAAGLVAHEVTQTVIGSPGVLDADHDRLMYAANLPGWHRAGLTRALADRLGSTCTIDNDANLAALGEHTYGAARGVDDFVYIHIGTGIGMGIFLNGRMYRGFTGAAGEIGYLPIGEQLSPHRPGQPMRGILEEALAADAVVRYATDAGMSGHTTAQGVFAAAQAADPAATRAVLQIAQRLAQLLASVSAFLDPELIVIGGGVGQNLDTVLADTRSALLHLTPMQPTLTTGQLGSRAVVRGALARGLETARETVFTQRIKTQPTAS